ncbi:MAG: DUF4090 family protein [Symploca sp. SIO2E9]|nr:DUF4090 family protein [Symploca sp. SIO2E9]
MRSSETNSQTSITTSADAIDEAIAKGIDLDGSPIPEAKLSLYQKVKKCFSYRSDKTWWEDNNR